jgi:hypothetical protein
VQLQSQQLDRQASQLAASIDTRRRTLARLQEEVAARRHSWRLDPARRSLLAIIADGRRQEAAALAQQVGAGGPGGGHAAAAAGQQAGSPGAGGPAVVACCLHAFPPT